MTILYEVNAKIGDPTIADDWARWIRDEHIGDVVRAGAASGRLLRIDSDDDQLRFSVQYEFASRDALNVYLRDHAPRLRAEGVRRFPLEIVSYSRRIGETQ